MYLREVGVVQKTPTEIIPCQLDFIDQIIQIPGEVIDPNLAEFIIYDSAGNDVSSTMLMQKFVTGTKIRGRIQLGDDGEVYTIKIAAVTQNYRFEGTITLSIIS